MDPRKYDDWYQTRRGRWIGEREARLVLDSLKPGVGESLLDVGCGTGYFTRTFAASLSGQVVGVDINPEWVDFARRINPGAAEFLVADALALPFDDASFDLVVSVAAVCFMEEEAAALEEMVRVSRRRIAVGLFNVNSLLYLRKGRNGGSGGYTGARWHSVRRVKQLFKDLPVRNLQIVTAIQLPGGGRLADLVERLWPESLSTGGFILAIADI